MGTLTLPSGLWPGPGSDIRSQSPLAMGQEEIKTPKGATTTRVNGNKKGAKQQAW